MNLDELQQTLPNGLHDADLLGIDIDYPGQEARLTLRVWLGNLEAIDESERERYRPAILLFSGLQFLVIDPPDQRPTYTGGLRIEAGSGQPSTAPAALPPLVGQTFLCWLFVDQWNSFIRIAAHDVRINWSD